MHEIHPMVGANPWAPMSEWETMSEVLGVSEKEIIYLHPTMPCMNTDGSVNLEEQHKKIEKELKEAKDAHNFWKAAAPQEDGKYRELELEEYIDTMTAIMTYLTARGYKRSEIAGMVMKVNLKNKTRGYWEERK